MEIKYQCNDCGKKYDPQEFVLKCTCGGMLNIEKSTLSFSKDEINKEEWSLFRYLKSMPFDSDFTLWKDITMGEGMTAVVPYDNSNPSLLVKMDYMMPTLSFKDRGAAVLIAKAKELGVTKVIQDSSGNAGNAIAAYAARAGIECEIYVPEGTSPKKIKMISSHGAKVNMIPGTREDTAKVALNAVLREKVFYASHVYNPFFYEGTKTYAYEIFEQLNGNIPETIVVPVGNGTLLLGAYYGFKEMLDLGWIDKLPRFIAVQADGCAPIYEAFIKEETDIKAVISTGTKAEGIAIANPLRGKQILSAIRETGGIVITAPEEEITNAQQRLAKKGFYVEPTTAATFAGYFEYIKNNPIEGRVLIPLCGAGLKSDK
ncbi:MAG: threonine synthase [Bacillota bacterium]|nr:threonine synthase [Bacillota bacterium]